jgi:putative DNA primase/helicase
LNEVTNNQVFIAFDAGNLTHVARIVRAKNPDAEIIIAGDNDLSNVGQNAARLAALAINAKYIIPPVAGMDWNDYLSSGGTL